MPGEVVPKRRGWTDIGEVLTCLQLDEKAARCAHPWGANKPRPLGFALSLRTIKHPFNTCPRDTGSV